MRPTIYAFSWLIFTVAGCSPPTPAVSITSSDLIGTWTSDDFVDHISMRIHPDLSYDVEMKKKTATTSLGGLLSANFMLGMLASASSGHVTVDTPNQITFVLKREEGGALPLPARVHQFTADRMVFTLGSEENSPCTFIRSSEHDGGLNGLQP